MQAAKTMCLKKMKNRTARQCNAKEFGERARAFSEYEYCRRLLLFFLFVLKDYRKFWHSHKPG